MAQELVALGLNCQAVREHIDRLAIAAKVGQSPPEPDDRLFVMRITVVFELRCGQLLLTPAANIISEQRRAAVRSEARRLQSTLQEPAVDAGSMDAMSIPPQIA